jgi:hypothetical protein
MAYITKYWLNECLSVVEFFFREYIIKILEDKKPMMRMLNLVFKCLAKILERGKVTVQLYINFDCEVNKDNLIEKVLFELAKMIQDRFGQVPFFNKNEKKEIKNLCLTLFAITAIGLNNYRKQEPKQAQIE